MTVIYGPTSGGAWIPGTGPNETIYGYGNGNSLYDGYGGTNYLTILNGGNDNDLNAGPGVDVLNGGSGTGNIASYQLAPGPVTASLANPSINTGWAAGDTYIGIHALTGSPFGGSLYGDNSGVPNQLWGLGGTNYLYGGASYATLISGPGADHMVAGSGGGFVDYEVAKSGVTASLLNSSINTGEAAGDTYSGLHNIGGSAYGDTLYADNAGDNILGGVGNNTIHGGSGNDAINAGPGANTVWGGGASDEFVFGGAAIAPGDTHADPMQIITNAGKGIYTTIMDFDQGNSSHYDATEYDSIDLSQLVSSQYNHGGGQSVGALVNIVEDASGKFANVRVDVDGSGSNFLTIAHLQGVPAGGSVHVILDDTQSSGVIVPVQSSGTTSVPNDMNNDLLWFNPSTGQTDFWDVSDGQWAASFSAGSSPAGFNVVGVGHLYSSGPSDILWQNSSNGAVSDWKITDGRWAGTTDIGSHPGAGWQTAGTGDFNGDGLTDVLWFNQASGQTDIWDISNGQWAGSFSAGAHPVGYQVAGVGDFNGNGTSDILFYNSSSGHVDEWLVSNNKWAGSVDLGSHPGGGWQVAGTGDFTGKGTDDVLWYNAGSGQTDIWELSKGKWSASVSPGTHPSGYQVAAVGDFNHDGTSDIVFVNAQTGAADEWKISNGHWAGSVDLGVHPGANWRVAGVGDFAHF